VRDVPLGLIAIAEHLVSGLGEDARAELDHQEVVVGQGVSVIA
jgi:hypothetical protein